MGRLSITTAWNESASFLKRHFGSLFTIAVALIALPNVAMQAFAPVGAMAPGQPVQPGPWLLLFPVVLVLGMVGSLAISTLALGREAIVGDALRHGFRRVLPMLGAAAILSVAAVVLFVPLVLLSGLKPENLIAPNEAIAGRIGLVLIVLLLVALFFAVRLLLLTPVAAAEPGGPVAIITRSWALTRGHFWRLLGFVLLMTIAAMVAMMAATLVLGLIIGLALGLASGPPQPGSVGGFVMLLVAGLLNAAFVVVMTTMVARIYVQLAGVPAGTASGT